MKQPRPLLENERRIVSDMGSLATYEEIGAATARLREACEGQNQAALLFALVGQLRTTALDVTGGDIASAQNVVEAMILHFRAARVPI